jgi:hypothetical protein
MIDEIIDMEEGTTVIEKSAEAIKVDDEDITK